MALTQRRSPYDSKFKYLSKLPRAPFQFNRTEIVKTRWPSMHANSHKLNDLLRYAAMRVVVLHVGGRGRPITS